MNKQKIKQYSSLLWSCLNQLSYLNCKRRFLGPLNIVHTNHLLMYKYDARP